VRAGDRVAGYLPNCADAVCAMLGAATLGAVWCSASPDFGAAGVLERLTQVAPSVLVTVEAVRYNGKVHCHLGKAAQVAQGLPSVRQVVLCPFVSAEIDCSEVERSITKEDFLATAEGQAVAFEQVDFAAPLFIMFSSGTTGAPKCLVHSVGGTLIQISKEHMLHCDLKRSDVMAYYTTTGWMMWQWLVSGLFVGCSLLLYDGSPLLPHVAYLWDLVDRFGVTVLGTGAKWLAVLEDKGVKPLETHDLASLRMILSTGSPLTEAAYEYVYEHVKKNVLLGSISGGTDIISCFMGCCPLLPVYSGEIQCRMLGMAIEVWDDEQNPIMDEPGELVCTKPFPSMPVFFWGEGGEARYHASYFGKYAGTWHHGDYCQLSSLTGGLLMLGRSDGTLNPSGVRFGSAEIYQAVEGRHGVADAVVVGQRRARDGEERVVLCVALREGLTLSEDRRSAIRATIRQRLSARHVPAVLLQVDAVPYTRSGKKVEVAVRQSIHGEPVPNTSSLVDPTVLEQYRGRPELAGWC